MTSNVLQRSLTSKVQLPRPFDATGLPVIRMLKWPTVRELIDFESQKMVFRSLNSDVPPYVKDIFTRVNESTERSLRNAEVNAHRTSYMDADISKTDRKVCVFKNTRFRMDRGLEA